MDPEKFLKTLMNVALKAADPYAKTLENLPARPSAKLFILAVGKTATRMAGAASDHYGGDFEGILLAPKGYVREVKGFEAFAGSHPLPSQKNVRVTGKIMEKVVR